MQSFVDTILFGSIPLSFWKYFTITMVLTQITIMTVTIYYHRAQAHRALELHPLVAHFFRFWGWLTTGMNVKEWVSVHRRHHAKNDQVEDPHSPVHKGIFKILFFGVVYYYRAALKQEILEKHGAGTPDDWIERKIYSRRYLGICIMFVIDVVLFGLVGVVIWLVQMSWIPLWAAGVINGLGHWFGYRNKETNDHSTNIVPWGLFIGGEELHNNHHANPKSAKLSSKWYEIDIGWFLIRVFEMLRLARVKYKNN